MLLTNRQEEGARCSDVGDRAKRGTGGEGHPRQHDRITNPDHEPTRAGAP